MVPVGEAAQWTADPFGGELKDAMLTGRGAADMKGAIACFVAAAARFAARHKDGMPGAISLLITGDEEGPAINGTKPMLEWLAKRGEKLDACLVGEPTNPSKLGEMIKIGRRGSLTGRLSVHGVQGHSAYPASRRQSDPSPAGHADAHHRAAARRRHGAFPALDPAGDLHRCRQSARPM